MNNLTKLVLALLVSITLVMLGGCKDDKTEQSYEVEDGVKVQNRLITTEYFPAVPGLYKKFIDAEDGWEETVYPQEKFEGVNAIPVRIKRLGAPPTDQVESIEMTSYTSYFTVSKEEVRLIGLESEISPGENYSEAIDPSWTILMFGMQRGSEWAFEMTNPPGTVKVEVVQFENVETKAGTFKNAVKLKLDYEYISEGGEVESTTDYEWYAPDVGLVKIQSDSQLRNAELVEVKTVPLKQ